MDPALLLADEPTGNIASAQAKEIMAIFQEVNEKQGHTIVMITHEPDIAAWARRKLVFRDGLMVEDTERTALAAWQGKPAAEVAV